LRLRSRRDARRSRKRRHEIGPHRRNRIRAGPAAKTPESVRRSGSANTVRARRSLQGQCRMRSPSKGGLSDVSSSPPFFRNGRSATYGFSSGTLVETFFFLSDSPNEKVRIHRRPRCADPRDPLRPCLLSILDPGAQNQARVGRRGFPREAGSLSGG
jgi:hypothetical protein